MEFGDVQTAYLGINYAELNSENAKKLDLTTSEGVLVTGVQDFGAAKAAGIMKNDIIINIDNTKIKKFSDLQGYLSSKHLGDAVKVSVLRDDKIKEYTVILANQFGKKTIGKFDFTNYHIGMVKKISKKNAAKFRIDYGVEIVNLKNRELKERVGIKTGDMILKINDAKVYSADDVETILRKNKGEEVILQFLNQDEKVEYVRLFIQS